MCNSQIQNSIIGIMNNLLTIVTQMYVGVQKYYKLSNGQLHKLKHFTIEIDQESNLIFLDHLPIWMLHL